MSDNSLQKTLDEIDDVLFRLLNKKLGEHERRIKALEDKLTNKS